MSSFRLTNTGVSSHQNVLLRINVSVNFFFFSCSKSKELTKKIRVITENNVLIKKRGKSIKDLVQMSNILEASMVQDYECWLLPYSI